MVRIVDPVAYKNDILLGRITKVSGFDGTVIVKLEKRFIENIPRMESVFLEIDGKPVPFFIEAIDYHGADILRLRFRFYKSIEKVSEFAGCRIFLTTLLRDNIPDPDNPDITGYTIMIGGNRTIGSVSEIILNNGQWLLSVRSENLKNFLIPFHEDLIISVDKKLKRVLMNIPEGLLDIN